MGRDDVDVDNDNINLWQMNTARSLSLVCIAHELALCLKHTLHELRPVLLFIQCLQIYFPCYPRNLFRLIHSFTPSINSQMSVLFATGSLFRM